MKKWSLDDDLEIVANSCNEIWQTLRGSRLFLTGGTGFIGCWLLESLRYANLTLGLNIEATILTRNPEAFQSKSPHLADHQYFRFVSGDVCNFASPPEKFSHVIHAATDASAELNKMDPRTMFDTIVQGTRRTLEFAREKGIDRMLFLSSGAVYGPQPVNILRVSEDWYGSPNCSDPQQTYGEAKRAAEMLCSIYGKQFGLNVSIARIFALLGPYLPLNIHFAAGNFILDAIEGRTVTVSGDGQPHRSYLYASDLTIWLWHILIRAKPGKTYNVGSDESISVKDLAKRISELVGNSGYQVLGAPNPGWNPGRYVPETKLAGQDLGLYRTVSLDDAILRTANWNGWKGKSQQ